MSAMSIPSRRRETPRRASWASSHTLCGSTNKRPNTRSSTSTKNAHKRYALPHSRQKLAVDLTNAPQMLQYYESHLVFTHTGDEALNGDDDGNDIMMKDY